MFGRKIDESARSVAVFTLCGYSTEPRCNQRRFTTDCAPLRRRSLLCMQFKWGSFSKFFFVLFRMFHLRLKRDTSVFSEGLQVEDHTGQRLQVDTDHLYSGEIVGERGSHVFGSIHDGVFQVINRKTKSTCSIILFIIHAHVKSSTDPQS